MTKRPEIFREVLGSLLFATFGMVIGTAGLLFIAIAAQPFGLAPWLAWLRPERIWPYGIVAIPLEAGVTTLLQAAFYPAAYRSMWLDEADGPCLPVAVVDSYLIIHIQISFFVYAAGLLSMIGGGTIAALLQSEAIGWSTAETLSSGLMFAVAALFMWGAIGLVQWLTQPDSPGEDDECGKQEQP